MNKKCIVLDRSKSVLRATDRAAFQIRFLKGEYIGIDPGSMFQSSRLMILIDGQINYIQSRYVEFVEDYF